MARSPVKFKLRTSHIQIYSITATAASSVQVRYAKAKYKLSSVIITGKQYLEYN